ncbi:MAG: hypothetical protein M3277_11125 [Actinomycetota bacterium]|nr:hypothetical protein [Actinomycetota bacterium]
MSLRKRSRSHYSKTPARLLVILAVIMAFFAAASGIAHAHHKDGHDGGRPPNEEASDEARGAGSNESDDHRSDRSSRDGSSTDGSNSSDGSSTSGSSGRSSEADGSGASSQSGPTHGCAQAGQDPGNPYESTCDLSPSGNGNDRGGALGRPCAGCVGAADNKNPPGQFPDGSDHNNGYECDGNNGIGKGKDEQSRGNPAHTGCVRPLGPPPPPPNGRGPQGPRPPGPPGPPGPPQFRPDQVLPRVTLPVPEERGRREEPVGAVLPITGIGPFRYLLLSLLLMMIGAVFMAYPFRRRAR